MDEKPDRVTEMRSLAVDLVRAYRHDDQQRFIQTMDRCIDRGVIRDTLLSLCVIVNGMLSRLMDDEGADQFLDDLAGQVPVRERPEDAGQQTRADAVAYITCIAREDTEGAKVILRNTPDLLLMLGEVTNVLAAFLQFVGPQRATAFLDAAREIANEDEGEP